MLWTSLLQNTHRSLIPPPFMKFGGGTYWYANKKIIFIPKSIFLTKKSFYRLDFFFFKFTGRILVYPKSTPVKMFCKISVRSRDLHVFTKWLQVENIIEFSLHLVSNSRREQERHRKVTCKIYINFRVEPAVQNFFCQILINLEIAFK